MKLSYKPLWKILIEKDMTRSDLMKLAGIGKSTLYKLTKSGNVTTDTLLKICDALKCDISEIVECVESDE